MPQAMARRLDQARVSGMTAGGKAAGTSSPLMAVKADLVLERHHGPCGAGRSRQEPSMKTRISLLHRLRTDSQALRMGVQGAFVVLCLWIGVEFHLFMRWASSLGAEAYVPHPPGAEGFLPISALMSLKLWVASGRVHPVHPAGLFILVAILAVSLLLKKAFCSWICPVGALSEALGRLGLRLLGRPLGVPRWLDWPLRSLKYLLLGFFLWAVGSMSAPLIDLFLDGPYNRVADLRMYLFFAELSSLGRGVIGLLAVLSVSRFTRRPGWPVMNAVPAIAAWPSVR